MYYYYFCHKLDIIRTTPLVFVHLVCVLWHSTSWVFDLVNTKCFVVSISACHWPRWMMWDGSSCLNRGKISPNTAIDISLQSLKSFIRFRDVISEILFE